METLNSVVDLVRSIVTSLVDDEDQVHINPVEGQETLVIEVRVSLRDVGKIIGKRGDHLKAIRMLVQAASRKLGKRVALEMLETQRGPRHNAPVEEYSRSWR